MADTSHRSRTPADHTDLTPVIGNTISIYTWGFRISLALVLIGLVVGFIRDEPLTSSLGSPDQVFREFFDGHSNGILGVGILVMILTPLIGVTAIAINFFRINDRRFGLFATAIILILIGSVAFSYI